MTKKKERIPMKGGDEYDALTAARKFYMYLARSGVSKAIKKKYNKRFRRHQKEELRKRDD
tara:strand:+ start:570 stop:749 length:180 start_codon:yes stop_codon:yes gene_type:complete